MKEVTKEELRGLSTSDLSERIDKFFIEDMKDRYDQLPSKMLQQTIQRYPSASKLVETKAISSKEESEIRECLLAFYRVRLQMSICDQYYGFENLIVHNVKEDDKWQKPKRQIQYASLRQAAIISGRITFESLMELVYRIVEGDYIPSRKSKLKAFRKWLTKEENPFDWLLLYLIIIYRYDRSHRSPEIHGLSRIAKDTLLCSEWPRQDGEVAAINLMLNIWERVLSTLNEENLNNWYVGSAGSEALKDYLDWGRNNPIKFYEKYMKT